ncbi:MAG: hypothetical protein QG656_604, partial [Candidatus Hydrogenedentes bacterium]|nr:hypothetical protein [Candidatus Hydrogenedentota bacterium]
SYALQFGEQQTVTVRFSPTAQGPANAVVTFTGGGDVTLNVTGAGATGNTVITVTPATHDFGEVEIGESADATFTVTNTGEGTLTGQVTTSNALFGVAAGGSYSLTAGQSQAVTIRFSPEAEGQLSATVNFSGALGATAQVSGVGKEKKRGCFGGTIAGPPAPPDEYGDLLVLTLIALTLFAVGRKNAPALRTAGPIRE